MSGRGVGGFWPMQAQLWREMAHSAGRLIKGHDRLGDLCQPFIVDGLFNNQPPTYCQYRYPSPRRSGPFSGAGPTPPFWGATADPYRAPARVQKGLVFGGKTADSVAHNNKQSKGSIQCNIFVLSPHSRPSLRFPRAFWTTTLNGVWPGRRQVRSLRTWSAATSSPGPSRAVPQALCATKSPGFAANPEPCHGATGPWEPSARSRVSDSDKPIRGQSCSNLRKSPVSRWLRAFWPLVTTIWNAVSQVRPQGLSSQTRPATMLQPAQVSAHWLAFSVTTQASAATANRFRATAQDNLNRRSGSPLSGGFAF